jgi:hypothetical protein
MFQRMRWRHIKASVIGVGKSIAFHTLSLIFPQTANTAKKKHKYKKPCELQGFSFVS